MATGDKIKGKLTWLILTPTSGSPSDVGGKGRKISYKATAQSIDVTTFDSTAKEKLADDPDISFTVSGVNVVGGAEGTKHPIGEKGSASWGFEGNTTGKPSYTAPYEVTDNGMDSSHDGLPEWNLGLSINELPTTGVVA